MNKLIPFFFLSSVLLLATTESTFHKSVNAQSFQRNRPDLNGLLVRNPGDGRIFWVDRGQIRHIAGPSVYGRLFVSNHRDYLDTDAVEPGPSITHIPHPQLSQSEITEKKRLSKSKKR
ncbi:hypothetical protein LAY57_14600, partial [Argonema antarcticum A004/B2]|nr:hypothetical protein [Argonema antarcticum A004/B2]